MSNHMDWQQKAEALCALAEIEVRIRKAGDWYVRQVWNGFMWADVNEPKEAVAA